jgi:hypothetical protein
MWRAIVTHRERGQLVGAVLGAQARQPLRRPPEDSVAPRCTGTRADPPVVAPALTGTLTHERVKCKLPGLLLLLKPPVDQPKVRAALVGSVGVSFVLLLALLALLEELPQRDRV